MTKALSIIVFDVAELPPCYLDTYFRTLSAWNGDALRDVQITIICQRETNDAARRITSELGIEAEIVSAGHEFVAGYPIWDNLAATRKAWSSISGQYVTFNHPEFIWGPERLRRTIDWLADNRPCIALGNLRRPGNQGDIMRRALMDGCLREASDHLMETFHENPDHARDVFENMETASWIFWAQRGQQQGPVPYIEDVFFADREWLEAWAFTDHGGEMPFQDVWDLMGIAMTTVLPRHGLAPQTIRMSQHCNRMIHLWHEKRWDSWTPEIRDWFLGQPARWANTQYRNPFLWQRLLDSRKRMPKFHRPVFDLRNGPGGSVMRYARSLNRYLLNGGRNSLKAFYAKKGACNDETVGMDQETAEEMA